MRPGLNDLDLFVTVARTRNFARAAKERGVSSSAISQAMRGLEARLGVRLLNRTTRSVSVTEAGEVLLDRLAPALLDVAAAVESLSTFRERPAGSVRINAPAPAIEFVLGPLVAPFLRAYPDITLELFSEGARVDIVEERFDAGVRFGEEVARDMIAVPLGPPLHYIVAGSPEYLAQHGTPREPSELSAHTCLQQRFPGGTIFEWSFQQEGREITFMPEGRLVVNDARHLVRAAVAGLGLARVLHGYARDALEAGDLVEVLENWCPRIPGWFLYYPSRRHQPPAMRAFLDFIARQSS